MAKFKKLAVLCMALLTTVSLATFAACSDDDKTSSSSSAPEAYVLEGDEQTVNASAAGVEYTFTSKINETYVLSWDDENAVVKVNGSAITSAYKFTLTSGQSISFFMYTADNAADTYAVTLEVYEEPVYTLDPAPTTNAATVNASGAGVKYSFTANVPETYMLTWTDENAAVSIQTATGAETIESGDPIELASGETIIFIMGTVDFADDSYVVTLSKYEAPAIALQPANDGACTVSASMLGVKYYFTSKQSLDYMLTWTDENAAITMETPSGAVTYTSGTLISLGAGDTVVFFMGTEDWSAEDEYVVYFGEYEAPAIALVPTDGDNVTVSASNSGVKYYFTAKVPGDYMLTWTDENAAIEIETESGAEEYTSGSCITLAQGESVVFFMYTNDWSAEGEYVVTISAYEEPTPAGNVLTLDVPTNIVNVNYDEEISEIYTFTASEAGTYQISVTGENFYISIEIGMSADSYSEGDNPKQFVLAADETVTFDMTSWKGNSSYTVTLTKVQIPAE